MLLCISDFRKPKVLKDLLQVEPTNKLPPIHPGEILQEEFMTPLSLSANALARALRVPPNRITAILSGKRSMTGDTALRLARYFGTTAQLWMNLRATYEDFRAPVRGPPFSEGLERVP